MKIMNKVCNFTKKVVRRYFEQTMHNSVSTPTGMIPFNYYRKYFGID